MNDQIKPATQPDVKLTERLVTAEHACLSLAALVAAVILAAWLHPGIAASLPAGWDLMKANTALSMLLGSLALFTGRPGDTQNPGLLRPGCAAGIIILAGSALYGHLSGQALFLDTLIAADPDSPMPGRMSMQDAGFLLLFALALLFEVPERQSARLLQFGLHMLLIILILIIFSGYCFGAVSLFSQSDAIRTSPQALACMILLTFALTGQYARDGVFSVFIGAGVGSQVARKALPAALILPVLIIAVTINLQMSGRLSPPYAAALTSVSISVVVLGFIVWMAGKLNGLEEELRALSLTDELTKIYNRRGFYALGQHQFEQARRSDNNISVLYFDLDGLKIVNDRLGHELGSQLIADFAWHLRNTFRRSDVIARIGGDEFAVITTNDLAELDPALQRLEDDIRAENNRGSRPYRISYSVGGAASDAGEGEGFNELVSRADLQMYEQKRNTLAQRHRPENVLQPEVLEQGQLNN